MSVNGNKSLKAHVFYNWARRSREATLEASFNCLEYAINWAAGQAEGWPDYVFTVIEEHEPVAAYPYESLL